MIVTGHHDQVLHAGILFAEDPVSILCISYRIRRLIFHDQPLFIQTVFQQPFPHQAALGHIRVAGRRAAAGHDHIGVWIFLCARQTGLQPADQFVLHRAVAVQGKAEDDDAQTVILRKSVRRHIEVYRHIRIHIAPIVHDLRPRLCFLRIDFRHFAQDTRDICLCVFLIVSIIRDQLLDIRIGVRLRGLCPDRNAQSDHHGTDCQHADHLSDPDLHFVLLPF